MQLFVSSPSSIECARALDDVRLRKACLETVQILAAVGLSAYKPSHLNHPVTRWVCGSDDAKWWTYAHAYDLFNEYAHRFEKGHGSYEALIWRASPDPAPIPTVFCNAAANADLRLDFRHLPVHEAYRAYLNARWRLDTENGRKPAWTKRGAPDFYAA